MLREHELQCFRFLYHRVDCINNLIVDSIIPGESFLSQTSDEVSTLIWVFYKSGTCNFYVNGMSSKKDLWGRVCSLAVITSRLARGQISSTNRYGLVPGARRG